MTDSPDPGRTRQGLAVLGGAVALLVLVAWLRRWHPPANNR
jgi:hypothetical protein